MASVGFFLVKTNYIFRIHSFLWPTKKSQQATHLLEHPGWLHGIRTVQLLIFLIAYISRGLIYPFDYVAVRSTTRYVTRVRQVSLFNFIPVARQVVTLVKMWSRSRNPQWRCSTSVSSFFTTREVCTNIVWMTRAAPYPGWGWLSRWESFDLTFINGYLSNPYKKGKTRFMPEFRHSSNRSFSVLIVFNSELSHRIPVYDIHASDNGGSLRA